MIGGLLMWHEIRVDCSTAFKHFPFWADEWGYECFYESPWTNDPYKKQEEYTKKYDL